MAVPEAFYREAIDLNRYSNKVQFQIASQFNQVILDVLRKIRDLEGNSPTTTARLRSILAQMVDSLRGWENESAVYMIDELQNLKYILFNDIIIYHFHEIIINLDQNKLNIVIKQNNDSFTFNFQNLLFIDDDIIEIVDNLILESVNLYDYFNSQYNKISSIINYLKINLH